MHLSAMTIGMLAGSAIVGSLNPRAGFGFIGVYLVALVGVTYFTNATLIP